MDEYVYIRDDKNKRLDGLGLVIAEHRKVWIDHHGEIPPSFIIHHINGNKKDNRIENLKLVSIEEHSLLHRLPNRKRTWFSSGACKVEKITS